MIGATGAPGGGTGNDGQPSVEPGASAETGVHGPSPTDGRPPEETTRGGTTMTSARPADPYNQGPGYGQQGAQQYHPPQAYPAPSGVTPPPGQPAGPEPSAPSMPPSTAPPAASPAAHYGVAQQPGPVQGVRRPRTGARMVPRVRKARLRVAKADPWSVMKVSFLLSIALGICTIVAVAVLWMVMDSMGVFSTIGTTISDATGTENDRGFDLEAFLSLPRVLMFTSVIAVIDVVLATALATLGAFMYNISAGFVGGVELTLAEDE